MDEDQHDEDQHDEEADHRSIYNSILHLLHREIREVQLSRGFSA